MVHVYIVRCADGSLYVGHADNVSARIARHNSGRGAAFTAARRPVRPVYTESFPTTEAAVLREQQLKRWSRAKKEALAAGDLALLATL